MSRTHARHRAAAEELARRTHSDLVCLECRAPADLAAARLASRGPTASDATAAIGRAMSAAADPWPDAVTVCTSGEVADCCAPGGPAMAGRADANGGASVAKRIDLKDLDIYIAVEAVTMSMPAHSVTALIGPAGCGKSTVPRTINRLHELIPGGHVDGQVLLDGKNDPDVDPVELRRTVGMVFQRPDPFPTMSVRDNVSAVHRRPHDAVAPRPGCSQRQPKDDIVGSRTSRRANIIVVGGMPSRHHVRGGRQ